MVLNAVSLTMWFGGAMSARSLHSDAACTFSVFLGRDVSFISAVLYPFPDVTRLLRRKILVEFLFRAASNCGYTKHGP